MPDLTGQSLDQAKAAMNKYGVSVEVIGNGDKVLAQSPAAGTEIGSAQRIYVVMQEGNDLPVPDLTGKSLRDAMEVCSLVKVRRQSNGEGYVTGQNLDSSGDGRVLTLELKPYSEIAQGSAGGNGDKSGKTDKTDKPVKTESVPAKNNTNSKSPQDSVKTAKADGTSKKAAIPPDSLFYLRACLNRDDMKRFSYSGRGASGHESIECYRSSTIIRRSGRGNDTFPCFGGAARICADLARFEAVGRSGGFMAPQHPLYSQAGRDFGPERRAAGL
ncbi:PASTA domain-containing protein [Paenibacillus sp. P26]|nr:PASTA domain-containing protein [Paenibacillus sp. P26]